MQSLEYPEQESEGPSSCFASLIGDCRQHVILSELYFPFTLSEENTNYPPPHRVIVNIYCDMVVKTLFIPFNTLLVLYLTLHCRTHVLQKLTFFGSLDTHKLSSIHYGDFYMCVCFVFSTLSNRELPKEEAQTSHLSQAFS